MIKQEIFDKVCEHAQLKERSFDNINDCLYRGDHGKKCFVGVLIPDSLYHRDMEQNSINALIDLFPEIEDLFLDIPRKFLGDLQNVHDSFHPNSWNEFLKEIGIKNSLVIPECLSN